MTELVTTIDVHVAGEPLRIVTGGFPEPLGASMLERRAWLRDNADHLRRAILWEPRGHADMYGAVLTRAATEDGDIGVLFLHNEGYSTMCGHGIIGLCTAGFEAGLLPALREPDVVRIDTPAGRVTARVQREGDRVSQVSFVNVPAFVLRRDLRVAVPAIGEVRCDIAFGGAFYAYVDAGTHGLVLEPGRARALVEAGMAIKRAVAEACRPRHPSGPADLDFLYGTIFVETRHGQVHSRNACVFAEGELDRSPTGTGVSGRAALHFLRGELALGEWIEIESLLGTRFGVRVVEETEVGGLPAVVPEVCGSAWITGRHEFRMDPRDPLRGGFLLT